MNRRAFLLSLAPLAALLATEAKVAPGDLVITPGRGIGKVRLGMTRSQVRHALGAPRYTKRWGRDLLEERWARKPKDDSDFPPYVSLLFREERVVQVEVSSGDFATARGLSTKSTFRQIWRAYPQLRVREYLYEDYRGLYFDSVDRGLAFYGGGQADLEPHYSPEAIIVHPPGARVIIHPGGKPVKLETDKTRG